MLTPQWLDQLRSRITLSALVGRSVRLQKAGREHRACCPFHDEKSPSFYVNDEKGFYHCFGCGAHGDAIRWMTDHQGLAFMDAVKELAAEAGMDVPQPDPRAAQAAQKRDTLHDVTAAAQEWFRHNLIAPGGERARAYLATRGFNARTVERFGFGYAPEDRQALKKALEKFPEAMLIEAGLRIVVEERDPYDRFRDRLMLPIEDARGRVIGFGGRILDKTRKDAPKYLNSPETPLFDKGRTLYNLHRAAPAARQSGRMVVVEGYMDVIALAAAGIEEAVAPLGTALTEHQIELLWRHVEAPVLCFDGDAAGQRAAMRAITRALPLLRPAHTLRIVRLPEGQDPDDLIKAKGPAAMEEVLEQARNLVDMLWDFERRAQHLETPEDKAGLKARLDSHIESISHPQIKSLYKRELYDRFSAFAFPRRDWSVHGSKISSIKAAPNHMEPVRKHLSHSRGEQIRLQKRLGAAIAAGFMLRPEELPRHAEKLALVDDLDNRIEAMLMAEEPSVSAFNKAMAERQLPTPKPEEFDFMRFAFAWSLAVEDSALASLRKAVTLYADLPAIREALARATAQFQKTMSEADWKEQLRLQKRESDLQDELKEFERVADLQLPGDDL